MIRRIYIHNYRCFENFELQIAGKPSILLIGRNGSGKTTAGAALELLQKVARGVNRVRDLVSPGDFAQGRSSVPVRFEIEVELEGDVHAYSVAFEFPAGFTELRVFQESLSVNGKPVYTREQAKVHLAGEEAGGEALFHIDWHLAALPIIQTRSPKDALARFRKWLSRMLILRPIPCLIAGDSSDTTLEPEPRLANFADWFSGLIADSPSAYSVIDGYLKQLMPGFQDIRNPETGADSRSLYVHFASGNKSLRLPFSNLSDGEKCFVISAVVLAAKRADSSLFCYWDELDSHLSLDEVGHFLMSLREGFAAGGQFVATSHNPEAIRRFPAEATLLLYRRSHLEPAAVRPVSEVEVPGDLVDALIRGDVNP